MSDELEIETPPELVAEQEGPGEEVLREAELLGWTPKEQWRGPDSEWVDAEEFVRRGKEITPILRANNKRLLNKVEELSRSQAEQARKIAEQERTFAEFNEYHKQTLQQQKESALSQLREARKQAIENSDGAAFEQIEGHIRQIEAYDPDTAIPKAKPAAAPVELPPDFKEWLERNTWYAKDKVAQSQADEIAERLRAEGFAANGMDFLEEVGKRVREALPQRFGNPARSRPASVAAPSPAAPRKSGKSYDDLPSEAKDLCDRFVRTIPGFSREQYVRDYKWS